MAHPNVIGRYVIHERIASGGMAAVHFGRMLGEAGFARTVAIKRMHPHLALDPEFVAMFLDEARLVARIRHPNVVPTLDVVSRDETLFLVMEYVEGESLAHLLRAAGMARERMPPKHVSSVMIGVLTGLHAAHEAKGDSGEPLGIVHRDVSPQNVIVGVDGVARVLDFGVAKAAGQSHMTREGQVKGKHAYMAPEQVAGELVGPWTDVFAASVVCWEALTGRRLFHGSTDAEVMHKMLHGLIPAPSAIATDLPQGVDEVVMRGLQRSPQLRYPTAAQMAAALEDCVGMSSPRAVGEWVRRLAGERLLARDKIVGEIEVSGSRASVPDDPARSGAVYLSSPPSASGSRPSQKALDSGTQMSSISSASAGEPGPRRRRTVLVGAGLVAVLSVAAGTIAALAVRRAPSIDTSAAGAPSEASEQQHSTLAGAPRSGPSLSPPSPAVERLQDAENPPGSAAPAAPSVSIAAPPQAPPSGHRANRATAASASGAPATSAPAVKQRPLFGRE